MIGLPLIDWRLTDPHELNQWYTGLHCIGGKKKDKRKKIKEKSDEENRLKQCFLKRTLIYDKTPSMVLTEMVLPEIFKYLKNKKQPTKESCTAKRIIKKQFKTPN